MAAHGFFAVADGSAPFKRIPLQHEKCQANQDCLSYMGRVYYYDSTEEKHWGSFLNNQDDISLLWFYLIASRGICVRW